MATVEQVPDLQVIYNHIESGEGEDLSRFAKQMMLFA